MTALRWAATIAVYVALPGVVCGTATYWALEAAARCHDRHSEARRRDELASEAAAYLAAIHERSST